MSEQVDIVSSQKSEPQTPAEVRRKRDCMVALLGDVGGKNIRLTLKRLNIRTRESEEVKPV